MRVDKEMRLEEDFFILIQDLEMGWGSKDNLPFVYPEIPIEILWIYIEVKFRKFAIIPIGNHLGVAYRETGNRNDDIILEVVPVTKKATGREYCSFRGYFPFIPGEKNELLRWNPRVLDTPACLVVEETEGIPVTEHIDRPRLEGRSMGR